MSENSLKLLKLRKEIENCAKAEAAAIISDAQNRADESVSAAENEIRRESRNDTRDIIEKFKADERKRVSEMRFSEGKRVLMHRGKLVDEFFEKVKAEIENRREKPGYVAYLEQCIAAAEKQYSLSGAVIYCRKEDTDTVSKLILLKGAEVKVSGSIELGGITVKIPEKGILIDLTLDSALNKEREAFSSLKEMQL